MICVGDEGHYFLKKIRSRLDLRWYKLLVYTFKYSQWDQLPELQAVSEKNHLFIAMIHHFISSIKNR